MVNGGLAKANKAARTRPSLREQAAAHRATKGTRAERLATLHEKAKSLPNPYHRQNVQDTYAKIKHIQNTDLSSYSAARQARGKEAIRNLEASLPMQRARADQARRAQRREKLESTLSRETESYRNRANSTQRKELASGVRRILRGQTRSDGGFAEVRINQLRTHAPKLLAKAKVAIAARDSRFRRSKKAS